MTARTLDFRGYDASVRPHDTDRRQHLLELAEKFPVGARVVHACGREGTVVADHPVHVPGAYYGRHTAVCLGGDFHHVPMVFVSWDNDQGLTWRVWAPVAKIRRGTATAVNRPGNKTRIGGRR
ncbi:hypothetical protein ACIP6V_23570 [Streptomyces sp. NPDC088770]|uniref:hypothetical protein n=1 Tax=unclassified Streptomyces TaxID=2593676 RepID=UPI002DDB8B7F|nr:hypothetical protein [Streptomyces sp. NBC_01788]WSB29659.1 hypothetical protein OIE49_29345 [Streptomyces sp. NBC_01788]